tara:strand:- start:299 stop:553 length:255 start_codon:yes stop_codon:yes gene_type:complete
VSNSNSRSGSGSVSAKKRKLWKFFANRKRTYDWLVKELSNDKTLKKEINKYENNEWRELLLEVLLPESDNLTFKKYKIISLSRY